MARQISIKKDINKKIVCLGGGVGTVQVIKGLRTYSSDITVVVSMADDGGSAGRLRRLYSVPPPGDLINCLSALSDAKPILKDLLTYRFAGNRWGRLDSLEGHKIGNLILVALTKLMGDFNEALIETGKLFSCHGEILPSTYESVSIWAETTKGGKVVGEETIDLGKYKDSLFKVHLNPKDVSTPQEVLEAIANADLIIVGPGDVYTTILPVLLVPKIIKAVNSAKAKKLFILNIANKRETEEYTISNYLEALKRHCSDLFFDFLIINNNQKPKFKSPLHYKYVPLENPQGYKYGKIIQADLVDEKFPVQHDPNKLAKTILSVSK